jgi:hypothetical protein
MFIPDVRHQKPGCPDVHIRRSPGGYVHLNIYIRLVLSDVDTPCLLNVISPQVEVEVLSSGSSTRRRPRMNTHAAATLKGTPA